MKILISTSSLPRWEGDATTPFVLSFARYVQKQGNEVYVLAPHFPGAKKFEIMRGVRVYRFQYAWPARWQSLTYGGGALINLKKNKVKYLLTPLFVLFQFLNLLLLNSKHKFDLINPHWILPQGFTAWLLSKISSVPIVLTVHGSDVHGLKSDALARIKKPILSQVDKVIVNSSTTCKACSAILANPDTDVVVIPMGVDMDKFSSANKNKKIRERFAIDSEFLLFVGRLIEIKGVEYLLRAIPMILHEFPEAKLLIIGDGPEKEKYIRVAKGLGIDKNVIFAGQLQNDLLPAIYASADIFIGPSVTAEDGTREGLGVVFIEALASGTPVVASNSGGIPDVVQHGISGLLVDERDQKEIADAILNLLKNKEYARQLAVEGRNSVITKFDWRTVATKYDKLFKQTVTDNYRRKERQNKQVSGRLLSNPKD